MMSARGNKVFFNFYVFCKLYKRKKKLNTGKEALQAGHLSKQRHQKLN